MSESNNLQQQADKTPKKKRGSGKVGKIVKTVISGVLVVVLVVLMVLANTLLTANNRMVDNIMGVHNVKPIDNSKADTAGLDLMYCKSDYTKETIGAAEEDLKRRISEEGVVLLRNDNNTLPLPVSTTFSLFGVNSAKVSVGGGMFGGGQSIKDIFEKAGVSLNTKLFDFYASGKGSSYGLATGSVGYGDAEDFRINECPLSALQAESGLLDSVSGTTPVYFLKRVAGEGRDMPRSMYNHADSAEDKARSYIEPDSTELGILDYLDSTYDNVVLVVNSNAALELDWVKDYPSIHSIIFAPDGLTALPGILMGTVNPSGRTVDTFAADASKSPAAQNFGDYAYYNEDGTPTRYNYVSYEEGIYVGYKYYETRYEDVVLGQGNAGDYDYASEVCFPFGYGLSYTNFDWSDYKTVWNGSDCTVSVKVTNTGDVAGRDVVEVYAQSPYTDYDLANGVEKAGVQLVGYAKTGELAPGASETVNISFNEEQLKAYDALGAKTYILDAGDYYITAARNAHEAMNNVLAVKGKTSSDGMTADGDAAMVEKYTPDNTDVDSTTYATDSYTGVEITNHLDFARGDFTYLSRSDWQGTFPTHDGEVGKEISTWGNEINGSDGVSYVYTKTVSPDFIARMDAFDSGNPVDPKTITDKPVYGKHNDLGLIDMRGIEYDDPLWNDLLDELKADDYYNTIGISGYGSERIESIEKPFVLDADTAAGLMYGGTGAMFPSSMTLAQTWNPDLAREFGEMIGNEAVLGGTDGWYAPSMDIHRTPYSGRNGEYYSEDGFLSGVVGSNASYGCASKGVYTFIKHFVFNDQEDHRGDRDGQFGIATWLNEQAAREIYLKPFEMSMKSGEVTLNYLEKQADGSYVNASKPIRACQAVMTGFNRIGQIWVGGSFEVIANILRNEWGFKGMVMTDNANTSLYMDCGQMIAAGADVKLTSLTESARFDFDRNDSATYHYGKEAMHRFLYTVANSKAMNGAMHGTHYDYKRTTSEKITLAANIVCPILIVLLLVLTLFRFWKPWKKSQKADAQEK